MSDDNQQNNDDLQWLRQYKQHQEEILYSRINIFILVSSIFVGIFGVVLSQDVKIAFAVSCLGAALTIIWWLAVHRQRVIVNDFRVRLDDTDTYYKECRNDRRTKDKAHRMKRKLISGQRLLIDFLPAVFLLFWMFAIWRTFPKVLVEFL